MPPKAPPPVGLAAAYGVRPAHGPGVDPGWWMDGRTGQTAWLFGARGWMGETGRPEIAGETAEAAGCAFSDPPSRKTGRTVSVD